MITLIEKLYKIYLFIYLFKINIFYLLNYKL